MIDVMELRPNQTPSLMIISTPFLFPRSKGRHTYMRYQVYSLILITVHRACAQPDVLEHKYIGSELTRTQEASPSVFKLS